ERGRAKGEVEGGEVDLSGEEPYSFAAEPLDAPLPPPPERFTEIVVNTGARKVIRFPRPTVAPLSAVEEVTLAELGESVPALPRVMEAASPAQAFGEASLAEEAAPAAPH